MGMTLGLRTPTRDVVERWAWASLVANTVIILTGGLVRLTASGLGCPTWPRCTDESFVPHRALGLHGLIEFGNRLLTYVLIAIAIGTVVAVWRWSEGRGLRRLAVVLAVGIPFQGVIGGITVLTDLNPWIVALHLVLSLFLVAGSTWLLLRVRGDVADDVPVLARRLVLATYATLWVVVYLGTVVTGSGPHAGDVNAPRNGLDPRLWSHVHAWGVYVLVALTIVTILVLRRSGTSPLAVRAATLLLVAELAQGVIGFVQYFTDLPIALVAVHLVGAAVLVSVGTRLVVLTRTRVRERQLQHGP
ncbi:cytochrome c oxidase assembly protein subunit 15 [Aeromicrobium sp. SORGH_AS981]|uniref:COX15/CtaA family protein n=1 Tax=Aeromicrobium sp. SORGH_AS_0981 TaxID=3041802 RepID=UPI002855BA31|nr:COX15/CtaA family protein [Aeromicrobium sp. SORGH_AS_0981]MDR6119424.1 cytochrome c oxidase assembly protein subunit 15 [Aeromicrobium sp. SORGH_AS_0981]